MFPLQGPGGPQGMAGAKYEHNRVKENLVFELSGQLKGGPCQTLSSSMKVKVARTGLYTYPDVLVVCGALEFEDEARDTLLNPRIVIEVLSNSTETYDRGAKFRQYQQIPSLQEYILVAQDEPLCEGYVRQSNGSWLLTPLTGLGAVLTFATVPMSVPLADIYAGITFPKRPLR